MHGKKSILKDRQVRKNFPRHKTVNCRNGTCPKSTKGLADKAEPLPHLCVFAAGHQFSHPPTMFDSISAIYASVCLSPHQPPWPHPAPASAKEMVVDVKLGQSIKCYITSLSLVVLLLCAMTCVSVSHKRVTAQMLPLSFICKKHSTTTTATTTKKHFRNTRKLLGFFSP